MKIDKNGKIICVGGEYSTKSLYFPIPNEWAQIMKEARLNGSTLSSVFVLCVSLSKYEFKRFHQAEYK